MRSALEKAFSEYGTVSAVRLPTDRETGEMKGIGFIQFADAAGKVEAHTTVPFHLPAV